MPDYIIEPLDTDPESLAQDAVSYIQSFFPNWQPSDAQLDYIIIRAFALKAAIIADMASRVQRSIYRTFGSSITNIQPLPSAFANAVLTFTALDTLGHTIPSGTLIGLIDANGDIHLFSLLSDAVIPAASNSITGTVEAVEEGTDSNALSGEAVLVEQIDWIESVSTFSVSSGGADAEDDDTYLNRLTANLGLMAPRPILAKDFALISRNVIGVWRAAAVDNFLPGTNEVQTISHNYTGNGATGGTITWNGQTTAALAWNSTALQVQTALEGLPNVEVGDIVATGGPWPAAITLTFQGNQAFTNVAQITASAGTWTGGTTITINTTVAGVAANFAAENALGVSAIDATGIGINGTKKTELDTYLQSLRQQNFVVTVLDPAYTTVDITWAAVKLAGADTADVQSRGNAALSSYLNPANWGLPTFPQDIRGWDRQVNLRQQEFITLLNNIQGLDYVSSLIFSLGAGATQTSADKVMTGVFPLTKAGTISGTVT